MSADLFEKFGQIHKATYLERPNRFLARCALRGGETVEAYFPNPGRMWELLLPGVTLHVAECDAAAASKRKTRYTVLAVERDGRPVLLHTHLNNDVARHLLEHGAVPGFEDADVLRAEVTYGSSRFDFLLHDTEGEILLEVKSCTLFGNDVAMFPDAITERGRRHLIELAELSKAGTRAVVLFVVHTPRARWFMPDFHTDLAFSRTFIAVRDHIEMRAVCVEWTPDLVLGENTKALEIPWDYIAEQNEDRGGFIVAMRFYKERDVELNGDSQRIPAGHYLACGAAREDLSGTLARLRLRPKKDGPVLEQLCKVADEVVTLPVRSSRYDIASVTKALGGIFKVGPIVIPADESVRGLFVSPVQPLRMQAFHNVLQQFRMAHPTR
jgi:sugar fermentation stimulation protein A